MQVSQINIYPVKSFKGNSVTNCLVTERGLENDRRFMLVDAKNSLITQREFPRLATLRVEILKGALRISGPSLKAVSVPDEFVNSAVLRVRIWDSHCDAQVAADDVNRRFSEILATECRLVKMPDSTRRAINPRYNHGDEIVSFADGYPLLVVGEHSLNNLNERLEKPVAMNRFRPNIVVSDSKAFAEDDWEKIRIGATVFRATKPCARCVVTTVNQESGVSDITEPLKTLSEFRKAKDVFPTKFSDYGFNKNDVLFGMNLVPENSGEEIAVGDPVAVLSPGE